MPNTSVGLSASMEPRKMKKTKAARVRHFGIPGLGRIAITKDQGEASLFSKEFLSTRLWAIVRGPDGRLVEEYNLGSGLVTNVGVLALANDFQKIGAAKTPFNLFSQLKWHAWGTGATAAAITDIKLQTASPMGAAKSSTKAIAGTNTLSANGEGKPKLISTAKITEEETGPIAITEWGIHTKELLTATTGTPLTAKTATSGTTTGTALTASSEEVLGETLSIIVPTESEEIWGLITSNTTSVVTVPAWYKQSSGAVKEPTATSAYSIKPVMFDHRVFSAINVEKGNTIEFPWELEIKSGG